MSNKHEVFFSHNTDIWETPEEIYNHYVKEGGYFDPCPINPQFNGLDMDWDLFNFVNPPYSELKKWINKAISEMKKGNLSVLLIPVRSDTKAFRLLYENNAHFQFIEGRLKFSGKKSAPFPSVLVYLSDVYDSPQFTLLTREKYLKRFKRRS